MCLYPITVTARPKNGEPHREIVSCGKCLECLQRKSVEWSVRIMDEASQYERNCFVTLTYDDKFLPSNNSVSRREVQLFIKSLRERLSPLRIRFFACGEYGKKRLRPHYHIIIFNWFPDDAFILSSRKSNDNLYRSPFLESVWNKGFSSVGMLTLESAKYCAKYMQKFQFGKSSKPSDNIDGRYSVYPPFVQMSNRPGIGYSSVYRSNLKACRLYRNGKEYLIPRYYLKVMERDGIYLDDFKQLRKQAGELYSSCCNLDEKRKRYKSIFLKKQTCT